MFFLDTNVLAYTRDADEPQKAATAIRLLDELTGIGEALISTQVLAEFMWVVTRRLRKPIPMNDALLDVRRFQRLMPVVPLTVELFNVAITLIQQHQMTIWDAQIVAAAHVGRASVVLTEDMQSKPMIHGVTYANPFLPGFDWRLLPT